jgi:hypothetical protein
MPSHAIVRASKGFGNKFLGRKTKKDEPEPEPEEAKLEEAEESQSTVSNAPPKSPRIVRAREAKEAKERAKKERKEAKKVKAKQDKKDAQYTRAARKQAKANGVESIGGPVTPEPKKSVQTGDAPFAEAEEVLTPDHEAWIQAERLLLRKASSREDVAIQVAISVASKAAVAAALSAALAGAMVVAKAAKIAAEFSCESARRAAVDVVAVNLAWLRTELEEEKQKRKEAEAKILTVEGVVGENNDDTDAAAAEAGAQENGDREGENDITDDDDDGYLADKAVNERPRDEKPTATTAEGPLGGGDSPPAAKAQTGEDGGTSATNDGGGDGVDGSGGVDGGDSDGEQYDRSRKCTLVLAKDQAEVGESGSEERQQFYDHLVSE